MRRWFPLLKKDEPERSSVFRGTTINIVPLCSQIPRSDLEMTPHLEMKTEDSLLVDDSPVLERNHHYPD